MAITPDAERVLTRLRRGAATGKELALVCPSYVKRIFELRSAGYQIETTELNTRLFRYTLKPLSTAAPTKAQPVIPGMF